MGKFPIGSSVKVIGPKCTNMEGIVINSNCHVYGLGGSYTVKFANGQSEVFFEGDLRAQLVS